MLAGTARESVSARTALHARAWAKMAREARSFWLSSDLHGPEIELDAAAIKRNGVPLLGHERTLRQVVVMKPAWSVRPDERMSALGQKQT